MTAFMSDMPEAEDVLLEAEADRAVLNGNRRSARQLLERVTASAPGRIEPWMKLAAICRADGDLSAALEATSGALRIEPLGFVPLLLKATLLESAGYSAEAAESYGHALAQRPESIPPHLKQAVDHAETVYEAHVARVIHTLQGAGRAMGKDLVPAERRRVDRFATNIARKTRAWHSEPTHFHYPGLAEREFHDTEDFPWLTALAAETPAILAEFHHLMATERAELVPYIQYPEDQPLRQWKELNRNPDWTAVHLLANGTRVEANARHCTRTMAALDLIPQPRISRRSPNAMFSLLAPGTRIPPHTGVANTRLVCHLPLIVPEHCWFRVGAETREWQVGEPFVFDDTIEHEAANDSDQPRVVFIVDVWHPGLSDGERNAVAAMMGHIDGGEAKA
jgi:aspartyl/asparaginyl beta-hydroxylase (cupin superfamily)